jgi:hypothetical protein
MDLPALIDMGVDHALVWATTMTEIKPENFICYDICMDWS